MREEIRTIESELDVHETHTLFTLAGLHSFLQSHTYTEELTEISTKMDTLDSKLDSVNNSDILIREDLSCIKEDLSSLNETMNRISEGVEEHSACRPVGWGGSGGSDEPPARRRGSAVRPVSGRGNVAGPWDAESRKRERGNEQPSGA